MRYKIDYFGFVYLWYDTKHRKFIIGSHHGSTEDGYTTSTGGIHVERIFRSRPETMRRKILAYNQEDDLKKTKALEQYYLDFRPNIVSDTRYYNRNNTASGGIGGWDHVNSDPDRINPMSLRSVKKKHIESIRNKVSEDKHYFCKNNLGDNNVMKRESIKNKHPSLFTSENNPMNNKDMVALVTKIHTERSGSPVVVKGIEYPSLRGAARDLGMSPQKLRHRIKSDNFPDHSFKEAHYG